MLDRAGDIIDENRRGGGGDDDVGADKFRGRRQHLALEVDHLGHALEDDRGVGERSGAVLRGHDAKRGR